MKILFYSLLTILFSFNSFSMQKLEKFDSCNIINLDSSNVLYYKNFGDTNLSNDMIKYLDKLVDYLKQNNKLSIKIIGHTDTNGKDENDRKAKADYRITSIRNYLINKGISRNRLFFEGRGNLSRIYNNNKDNRVEIIFIK